MAVVVKRPLLVHTFTSTTNERDGKKVGEDGGKEIKV
jgi:hypothetical protein